MKMIASKIVQNTPASEVKRALWNTKRTNHRSCKETYAHFPKNNSVAGIKYCTNSASSSNIFGRTNSWDIFSNSNWHLVFKYKTLKRAPWRFITAEEVVKCLNLRKLRETKRRTCILRKQRRNHRLQRLRWTALNANDWQYKWTSKTPHSIFRISSPTFSIKYHWNLVGAKRC